MSKKPSASISPLVRQIITGIEEVKGNNITVLDFQNIENSVCEYFVICDATSNTQAAAIGNSIEKTVRENLKEKPWHVEGTKNAEWILMDYSNVVVHIFLKETRKFYDIESLWGDAETIKIEQN